MSLIWAAIGPYVPVVGVLVAAFAIGLFIVWLAVGGALWAAHAGRADGALVEEDPEWFAELPAESTAEMPAGSVDATISESQRR